MLPRNANPCEAPSWTVTISAALVRGDQRGQVTEIGVASRIGEKLATRLPQRPIEPACAGDVDDIRGNTLFMQPLQPLLPPAP